MIRLLPLLLLASCGEPKDDTSPPADTGDPPPQCDDGPHEATECGFHEDLGEGFNYRRLQNEAEGVDVIVVREATGFGPGETTQYTLRGFALAKDGCLSCIDSPDALNYVTGHHNWFDDAEATIEGVLHRCHMQYQPEDPDDSMSEWVWSYDLTGLDPATEDVLWGPIPLELTYPDSPW